MQLPQLTRGGKKITRAMAQTVVVVVVVVHVPYFLLFCVARGEK
jgi:hypothetical protein